MPQKMMKNKSFSNKKYFQMRLLADSMKIGHKQDSLAIKETMLVTSISLPSLQPFQKLLFQGPKAAFSTFPTMFSKASYFRVIKTPHCELIHYYAISSFINPAEKTFENIVEKDENSSNQYCLLFQQCFLFQQCL